ncbi:hypothetical protein mRhiFer1_007950 [Rhinolophus ferrumequinum]|uniref:Uncharacterized protein n=1 Tax=Rhinolophus ferrumequinum TaxID=59479 RepID=A0A7J8AVY6_RHIFE|nr:hypothetical protein mRhiFer1_007950 [Rhinolophus ferrumequinum]
MHMHATSLVPVILHTYTAAPTAMHVLTDSPSHEHKHCQLHHPKLLVYPQSALASAAGLDPCQCTCTCSWPLKLDAYIALAPVPNTTCSSLLLLDLEVLLRTLTTLAATMDPLKFLPPRTRVNQHHVLQQTELMRHHIPLHLETPHAITHGISATGPGTTT